MYEEEEEDTRDENGMSGKESEAPIGVTQK